MDCGGGTTLILVPHKKENKFISAALLSLYSWSTVNIENYDSLFCFYFVITVTRCISAVTPD